MAPGIWLIAPLIIGNTWHLIMPFVGVGKKLPYFKNSISENALRSSGVLFTHRAVHLGLAICFFGYSSYLWSQGLYASAVLLMVAALFDVAQVLKLSESTNHTPLYLRDTHQFLAWSMALSYFLFSIAFAIQKQLPVGILIAYVLLLIAVFIVSFATKQKYFWFTQMAFFVSTSTVMAVSAVV